VTRTFYVRPACEAGYGAGDGTSYANAWNGLGAVDWDAMAEGEPATLWMCGEPGGPGGTGGTGGFMIIYVERSFLAATPRIDTRREPAESV
jgi:hypothetical protein